jgi:signal transduction histidine kinase/two-component SAPR family response regulator
MDEDRENLMSAKKPVNILLVDDQPGKLLSYETILADLNENLMRATSGREALDLLLKNEIAVVLIDVCMPELDGFELASLIRSHPRFQKTAIILVSGVFVEDVDRVKGFDSGAVDYVAVPIVPEILRAKVAIFVDLFRKTEELANLNQDLENRVAERTAKIELASERLRESEERLRLVLTAGGIQGWTWNIRKNEITWVAPLGESENICQSFADFLNNVNPLDRPGIRNAFNRALAGADEYIAEFRMSLGEGEQWWLGRGTVLHDATGQPVSIAGININITAQKNTEQERMLLLKDAEDARKEAEQANQLKDQFLATLSHELRTPLNAITGWAQMLRAGDLDESTQHKALDTINRNAKLQTQLISDILDVSRITSGKLRLDLKPVNLAAVVQAALDTIRPAADAKNIRIVPDICEVEHISGDPARLQQVIWNLLSNAVKFSPANGQVDVWLKKGSSEVELTVRDNGPGIRADFLPHMFEPFRQSDSSSTRAHHGLGLGLSIVRFLVEMHGGKVAGMNREDRSGAILKATLPLQPQPYGGSDTGRSAGHEDSEAVSWAKSGSSLRGLRLLVVDDEPDAREVVSVVLQRCGAEVTAAASAGEAFELLQRKRPHALLADIEMPHEDGYSLVRKVRGLSPDRGGKTPAIALTAYAGMQDKARAAEAGFSMHIAKPIQTSELIAAVARLCHGNIEDGEKIHGGEASTISG